ncbi:MAG: NAD(P)H-binding protein [Limisphaerales bacterium]
MKFAITGGTGFVGRNIARQLVNSGHEVVLVARGKDQTDSGIRRLANTRFIPAELDDTSELAKAFTGCFGVVHCAGINRERGKQTYRRVHVEGTRNVIEAAQKCGVQKIALMSFLRARPNCGSGYHESKWAAEELVRNSGLDYTVFKCGVIYGKGDHMLDHLSHAFHTFPLFAFVGFEDKPIRPNAVEDVARIVEAALTQDAFPRKTVAVVGPEELTLRQAVRRVARVANRNPLMFPMPVWFHYALGWFVERIMKTPLVSTAQVRMLAEGLAEPIPACDTLPPDIAPEIRFTEEQIRKGLPAPGPFTWRDIDLCCQRTPTGTRHTPFFQLP